MANIMIVDDDVATVDVLKAYAQMLHHNVVASTVSGDESIKLAEIHKPDLILMDIAIPGRTDGIDAAAAIYEKSAIPSIFISGYIAEQFKSRAEGISNCGFLTKPFRPAELDKAIEEALAKTENISAAK